MIHYVAVFLSSLFMCSAVYAGSVTTVSLSTLSSTLNQRMVLMRDVAEFKAVHHLPVEDLAREENVISAAKNEAAEAGLDPQTVEPFVHALMNASKAIQYRYLADWLATPQQEASAQTLASSREQIQQLDQQLMTTLSQYLLTGSFSSDDLAWLGSQLNAPNLGKADIDNLLHALTQIRRAV
ncbi:chorismate mutase [Kosakonia oryzendophytica]|uniref:chorismate mutase n=1 Tax=Kosakonia oryzendophytica TaxID=1005665 RepID=UPI003D346169